MKKDEHLVNVNGQILHKETQTVGGRAAYLNLRSPGAQEEATSARSQGKHQTFSFPSHAPTCPLTQGWDQMHSYPKTELPVPWPFWSPLCFRGVEQILICPLQCTVRSLLLWTGWDLFQKAAGPGDHISLLTPLIGLWVRAIMKTSFGVSCNCPGKCRRTGPKATEGGRDGQICFVYRARMATR